MRKLIPTLLALPLMLPSAAYPLGLGDIRLHSALNQRFSGQIDLLSVKPEEAESIEVSLGSYETFARLGVDRVTALNYLDFEVKQRSDGSYYVDVSSQRPIGEPFLDFLIEVNWASGKVLREYTVLLDPPELMNEGAPSVSAPAAAPVVEAPKARRPQATQSATTEQTPASGSKQAASKQSASKQSASKQNKTQTQAGGSAPAPATHQIRTHHVVRGETLSEIARRMRPGTSSSLPQLMLAMLRANPEAFYDNNINRLKAGAVLRLDPALLGELSRAEAVREVARQTRAWQDYKQRAAQQAKGRPAAEPARKPGKAVATTEESRLKLVAPEKGEPVAKDRKASSAPGAKGATDDAQQLALALEEAEAQRQQNAELQKRLKKLEEQLADMQRLLTLKNDDLAMLQRQLKGDKGAAQEPLPSEKAAMEQSGEAGDAPASAEPAPAANAQVGPGTDGADQEQPAAGDKPVAEDGNKPGTDADPKAGDEKSATASDKPTGGAKPAAAQKPKRPVVVPPPAPEPTLVEQIFGTGEKIFNDLKSNTMLLYIIGGSAAVVLLLLFLFFRQRRKGGGFQESILTAGDTSSLLRAKQAEGEISEETSFFSDFAVSGMGDIQADDDEVDPLTEAGLYMDFGRYQQAEELLKEAVKHNPESAEVRATLLEAYYKMQNREAFELQAVDAQTILTNAGLWDKVLAMGHELAPDNPIFGAAPEGVSLDKGSAAKPAAAAAAGAEVMDIGLDLDAFEETESSDEGQSAGSSEEFTVDLGVDFSDIDESDGQEGAAADDGLVDLDLGFDDSPSEPDSSGGAEQGNDLDFDLGGLDLGDSSGDSNGADDSADGALELGGLDLDDHSAQLNSGSDDSSDGGLDFGGFDLEESTDTADEGALEFGGLDLDMGSDEGSESGGLDMGSDSGSSDADGGLEFGGLDLGADAAAETDTGESEEFDLGGLDLNDSEDQSPSGGGADDDLSSFDFGDLDLGGETEEPSADAESGFEGGAGALGGLDASADTGSDDLGDLDLGDFGGDEFGDDENLFGELDEMGTKLDLAKAYVDMGDADGARSILEEVLQDGDDAQKGQAQELMKQIA